MWMKTEKWGLNLKFILFLSLLYVALSEDFHSQGSPIKVKDGCTKCENKVEDADKYVCCGDCTYPEMIYDTSSGYCKSGAQLILQPKPKEVFKWVAGPWSTCSIPCGDGIRRRRVDCFAVIEDTASLDYPVYDDHCLNQEKLVVQEPCNLQSCVADVISNNVKQKGRHSKTSMSIITVLIFLGIVAVVVLGIAGLVFHRRRTCNESGYVYIMMEGFT
ncbi:uncharacterized protein LOC104904617 [Beta vulgaris subsp. vulgaris]|uniref:uncharacterized protein LOC104904617 n=1 Tax=Beta vulgaris subsp. vulgaris TaxID=3555 RepID=UPI0020369CA3|nr:uncharacterized protein LOC104904617 [Beta vulgaris subsp. vulgaris]